MLDQKDRQILRELERDCRQRTNQIANKTNIPVTTVHNRIKKLVSSGHISQFRAVLDPEKLGRSLVSFVLVTLNRKSDDKDSPSNDRLIIANIAAHACVQEIHTVTGDWDLLLKIRASNIQELEQFVSGVLREQKLIEKAQTICAMATYKETTNLIYNGIP